jgi:hypothetical protein
MQKSETDITNGSEQSVATQEDLTRPTIRFWSISAALDSIRSHPIKVGVFLLSIITIFLIGLIIYTSHLNTKKYYLKSYAGALEVWQGTFSPAGKKRVISMPGVMPPEKMKPVYARQDVYPLIFNYYLEKSDALIHTPEIFDFTDIKIYLNRALRYASTAENHKAVQIRLNRIDRVILYYKADVAASKRSIASLEVAVDFLNQAAALEPDDIESELIEKKKQAIQVLINSLKAD